MKNIFVGLNIIADSIDFRNPNLVPFVLAGDHDDILLQTFFYTSHRRVPTGDEHKTDVRAKYALNNLKEIIRSKIGAFFREAEREMELAEQAALERTKAELRQSNQPHHLGTVNEIVARYARFGISKSEVRRQKAAGTLDEFLEQLHQSEKK